MMDIEDQIAKIIKDEYSPTGYQDEGRSTAAAHDIIAIVDAEIERLKAEKTEMADAILQCFPHERRFRAHVSFELAEFIFTERRDALAAFSEKNS